MSVLCVAALLGGCGGEEAVTVPEAVEGQVTRIDSAAGRAMIDAGGALVIDVRSVDEYRGGHLVGAQSIPVEDEELWLTRTEPLDRERPTVVYCRSGRRSELRGRSSSSRPGFTKVYDLGGVEDWDPDDLARRGPLIRRILRGRAAARPRWPHRRRCRSRVAPTTRSSASGSGVGMVGIHSTPTRWTNQPASAATAASGRTRWRTTGGVARATSTATSASAGSTIGSTVGAAPGGFATYQLTEDTERDRCGAGQQQAAGQLAP